MIDVTEVVSLGPYSLVVVGIPIDEDVLFLAYLHLGDHEIEHAGYGLSMQEAIDDLTNHVLEAVLEPR